MSPMDSLAYVFYHWTIVYIYLINLWQDTWSKELSWLQENSTLYGSMKSQARDYIIVEAGSC